MKKQIKLKSLLPKNMSVNESRAQDELEELIKDMPERTYGAFAGEYDMDPDDAQAMTHFIADMTDKDAKDIIKDIKKGLYESINEAQFDAEKALHWHEPSEVIPEMVSAALIKSKPSDFYELMDLLGEYNISFELETAGSRAMEPNSTPSQIKQAVKYMNWDAFQDDNEIIQLQDYIEEIIGPF